MASSLNSVIKQYAIRDIQVISKIENASNNVYRIRTNDKHYILKHFSRKKNSNNIDAVHLQSKMSEYNLSPKIIPTKDGMNYVLINNEIFFLQEFKSNNEVQYASNLLNIISTINQMYKLLDNTYIEVPKQLKSEIQSFDCPDVKIIRNFYNFKKKFKFMLGLNAKAAKKAELIHGDLRMDNIIYNKKPYIIDFESVKYGSRNTEILKFLILFTRNNQEKLLHYINDVYRKFGFVNNLEKTTHALLEEILYNRFIENHYKTLSHKYLKAVINEHIVVILTCLKLLGGKQCI